MGSKFECFVTIGHKKHTITIAKDIHYVNFDDVVQQIRKIDPKTNVSTDSHVFEIYDLDTNSFKRLHDSKTLIKCLARIRVSHPFGPICDDNHKSKRDNTSNRHHKRVKTDTYSSKTLSDKNHKNDHQMDPIIPQQPQELQSSKQLFISSFKPSCDTTQPSMPSSSPPTPRPSSSDHSSRHKSDKNHGSDRKRKDTKQPKDSLNAFKDEGLVVNNNDKTYCQLCAKEFGSMKDAVQHIQSLVHMNSKREDHYEDIDRQFLAEIRRKNDVKYILSRKQELNKFSAKEKRLFVRHGIRLKDGFGPEAYVCFKCDQSFKDALQMTQHYNHYQNMKPIDDNEVKDTAKDVTRKSSKDIKSKDSNTSDSKKHYDLKVPEDVADKVAELVQQHRFEVLPKSRHKFLLKCRFCEFITKSVSKSFKHIESDEHIKWTTDPPFRGIDRLIVTESTATGDSDVLLARIETLREIPYTMKEEFLSHGIKVKDGFGGNAFVCTKCNNLFEKLKDCKSHLKEFHKLKHSLLNRQSGDTLDTMSIDMDVSYEVLMKQMESNCESIETMFRNEGIKYRKHDKSVRKGLSDSDDDIPDIYYYCMFCNTNFYSKETALYHLNRPFHKKIRRGEYMTHIDAMFSVKSDRIDELDIGFSRMEALYRLDNKSKIDLRDKGIRLKDGIGCDAYVCLKCNQSIPCETIDSAQFAIIRHTNSPQHKRHNKTDH